MDLGLGLLLRAVDSGFRVVLMEVEVEVES